jgi:UPF0755 protein
VKKRKLHFLILILIIISIIAFTVKWVRFENRPIILNDGLTYVVEPGTNIVQLASDLEKYGDLKNTFFFELYARLSGAASELKAGEYYLKGNSTPSQVLATLVSGKIVYHPFTLVNGWNIYDVIKVMNQDPDLIHNLKGKTPKEIAKAMHLKYSSPEGLLYPDTYYFTLHTTESSLLNRAYKKMNRYMNTVWPKRARGLPYHNQYQALIVASMVEKESAVVKERPIIADVILKRLKMWMPLQIDSAVIYGLEPHFSGNLTRSDLQRKTPYNTYTRYGLPPTPIAMPGPVAIQAALHPVKTKALYFVAKGDGSHEFSSTLEAQKKAVDRYQLGSKTKPIKKGKQHETKS